ncbi:MAG: type II toxin-antitoxin system HicB family antitoxin [Patescibacteria group bacterium]|nr:type II toxin-antitoxin system HicB family antitoxin [Patescibacteria group bacterium]
MKDKHIKELNFRVLIEQDEDGYYVASVPDLRGCYTQGKTLDDRYPINWTHFLRLEM